MSSRVFDQAAICRAIAVCEPRIPELPSEWADQRLVVGAGGHEHRIAGRRVVDGILDRTVRVAGSYPKSQEWRYTCIRKACQLSRAKVIWEVSTLHHLILATPQ